MTATTIRFGHFTIESGVGVTLYNHDERRSLFFKPGDEAGDFHDRLDAMSAADPAAPYEQHCAAIWADYRECVA